MKLTVSGDPKSLLAVLSRSGKALGRTSRSAREGRVTLTIKVKRRLAAGTYRLRVTVTGKDGRKRSTSRSVRIRRQQRARSGPLRSAGLRLPAGVLVNEPPSTPPAA